MSSTSEAPFKPISSGKGSAITPLTPRHSSFTCVEVVRYLSNRDVANTVLNKLLHSIRSACPAKGNTEGYTWKFPSVVNTGNLRGEHGTPGEPGYLLIEGKIADDGTAKLSATGIVSSRKYARGIFAHQGGDYSYDIKAHFQDMQGTGTRDTGLGIVGRPCTFDFVKQ